MLFSSRIIWMTGILDFDDDWTIHNASNLFEVLWRLDVLIGDTTRYYNKRIAFFGSVAYGIPYLLKIEDEDFMIYSWDDMLPYVVSAYYEGDISEIAASNVLSIHSYSLKKYSDKICSSCMLKPYCKVSSEGTRICDHYTPTLRPNLEG